MTNIRTVEDLLKYLMTQPLDRRIVWFDEDYCAVLGAIDEGMYSEQDEYVYYTPEQAAAIPEFDAEQDGPPEDAVCVVVLGVE